MFSYSHPNDPLYLHIFIANLHSLLIVILMLFPVSLLLQPVSKTFMYELLGCNSTTDVLFTLTLLLAKLSAARDDLGCSCLFLKCIDCCW